MKLDHLILPIITESITIVTEETWLSNPDDQVSSLTIVIDSVIIGRIR
jgi:hypothetical protein